MIYSKDFVHIEYNILACKYAIAYTKIPQNPAK